jgi:hypothetical protein
MKEAAKTIENLSITVTVTGVEIDSLLQKAGLEGDSTKHVREAILLSADNNALSKIWNSLIGVNAIPIFKVGDSVEDRYNTNDNMKLIVAEIDKYRSKSVLVHMYDAVTNQVVTSTWMSPSQLVYVKSQECIEEDYDKIVEEEYAQLVKAEKEDRGY